MFGTASVQCTAQDERMEFAQSRESGNEQNFVETARTSDNRRPQTNRRQTSKRATNRLTAKTAVAALLATTFPTSMAQSCISLATSTQCPAFNASSVSTDSAVTGIYPFLSGVTDTASFDSAIQTYISNGFTQLRYQQLLGCSNVNLDNTTAFYARYTTSVICNGIIQNSINACGLTGEATRPLCADSCAEYAQSEEEIVASNVCGNSDSGALTQIRADFTNCALPADSLTGSCIDAVYNQPDNCGFASNVGSLCSYCAASSPNSTDSCCVFSNTTTRCSGVTLPIIASSALAPVTMTITSNSSSATGSPSSTAGAVIGAAHRGLSGGAIAGIVVGTILGALLLLTLIVVGCLLVRKRSNSSPAASIFNQPAPMRQAPPSTSHTDGTREQDHAGMAVLGGGRVARMSALEHSPERESHEHGHEHGMVAMGGGYRKSVSSDEEEETPRSRGFAFGLAPPQTGKRSGSLSSGSQLAMGAMGDTSSPSTNDHTSPESQSEQLHFFKDYYSQDEIHTGDVVSTLWAYEPRAADEFSLERGDMIKLMGIWDDGWATGVRVRQRAEDWRPEDRQQRDSGMTEGRRGSSDGEGEGEVKAFPMVCVCLPQHWRKTIEGDSTEGTGGY